MCSPGHFHPSTKGFVMRYMAVLTMLLGAADAPESEIKGRWDLVQVEEAGQVTPGSKVFFKHITFTSCDFEYNADIGSSNRGPFTLGTYRLDAKQNPKHLDFTAKYPVSGDRVQRGIYEINGGTLRFTMAKPGQPRPTEFTPALTIEVWKRARPDAQGKPR